jgi:uncharacterized protein (TIGR03089 family)
MPERHGCIHPNATPMTQLIADRLRRRARTAGSSPLVTYYDLSTGERTELSATSFLNWVDKTSNLFVDEYLLEPGGVVDLELAQTAPGHWVTLVIELAAWQVGATVSVGGRRKQPAELLVLGPDWQHHDVSAAPAILACSLHRLGLGFPDPLPVALADFALEVRGQPDIHSPGPRSRHEPAWQDVHRALTQQELVSVDTGPTPGGARRLVSPTDPWSSVRDGLLVPLLTDGSSVLVVGDDPERLQHIQATERATL